MKTTDVINMNGSQAVRLPDEFRFDSDKVSVRRDGDAVVLEPIRADDWPADFFDEIKIDDPNFARPGQGELPPTPTLDG